MASATVQFGFDDAAVQSGINRMVANIESTATRLDRSLTLTPQVDASAMSRSFDGLMAQFQRLNGIAPLQRSNVYLDKMFAQVDAQTTAMEAAINRASQRSLNGLGGNARLNAGLIGAQVQDIAVQLQGGTSALTVFAQQGSQLASIFGPGGMVVGAIAALAGVTLAVSKNSKDAFDKLIAGASASHDEVTRLLGSGGLSEVESMLGKINAQANSLSLERLRVDGLGVRLGQLVGGDSPDERTARIQDEQLRTASDQVALQQRLVRVSKEEMDLAILRAQGRTGEADAAQRELKLKERIREIEGLHIGRTAKQQLIADAERLAAVEKGAAESAAKEKAYQDRRKAAAELQKQLDSNAEKQRLQEFDRLDSSGKLKAVTERIAQLRNLSDGTDKLADAQRASELIDLLGSQLDLQQRINDEIARKKDEQQAFNDMVDAENRRIEDQAAAIAETEAKKKEAKDKASLNDVQQLLDQGELNRLRAQGRERAAQRLESQRAQADKYQTMIDAGLDPAEAQRRARQMQRDEDRLRGRPTVIEGGRSGLGAGLLDRTNPQDVMQAFPALNAMQNRGPLRDTFQFPALNAKAAADLSARNRQNAAAQNRAERQTVSLAEGPAMVAALNSIDQKLVILS